MRKQTPEIFPLEATVDMSELSALSLSASTVLEHVRNSMLAPHKVKVPPKYSSGQMTEMLGMTRGVFQYACKKGELPEGVDNGGRKEWTLSEARQAVQKSFPNTLRNKLLSAGVVITIANFKGGVAKTSTTAALAQGLSLRGHKVLVIDVDPQGSLSTLFGVQPADIHEDETILPLLAGTQNSILSAVKPTYWDGVDLVAAAPLLFQGEFLLPARQLREKDFEFWSVLDQGLDEAREIYDVIVIDTPPALSYITINALIAAQGVVMPLPPSTLDFSSSTQFWSLFTDVCGDLLRKSKKTKKYSFVNVLLSRVDRSEKVSTAVKQWIVKAYGDKVLPMEIPKTATAATASAGFGTVYDIDPATADTKTLKRALEAYDEFVDHIAFQVAGIWAADSRRMMEKLS